MAYVMAALDPLKNRMLIIYSILAKFTATLFLVGYSLFGEMVWMVLVSGFADFLMGMILLGLYRSQVGSLLIQHDAGSVHE
jgi:hypothetical protein